MVQPLLVLGIFLLTAINVCPSAAAQKCRLRQRGLVAQAPFPTSPASTDTPSPSGSPNTQTKVLPQFDFANVKVRGVNLGGWFVLEPWITPSIFAPLDDAILDEFTLGQMTDYNSTQRMLESHWNTWYTEQDFADMSAAGLNFVRIPLGYWSVPTNLSVAPYHAGAWPYFLQSLQWAQKHSIYVIVDLHGAPGSQNGYDNSGQRTSNPVWALNPQNISRTLDVITTLSQAVGNNVAAIELLNEPAGFLGSQWSDPIRAYWQNGYGVVRSVGGSNVTVVIEDAFLGVQSWQGFLTAPAARGVMMDTHQYQIFNNEQLALTQQQHITAACAMGPPLQSFSASNIWTVLGEWSTAITDCAQWLNGRGIGARWDATFPGQTQGFGSCTGLSGASSTFSSSYKTFLRQYWEAQVDAAEQSQGWIYWTWKTESADEWSYQKGLEGGWIPQNPSQRQFPNLCG